MSEKIVRDPVHDVIAFRTDRPIEMLLFRLLNAAELQRLRRIRQLGMAHMAYPGADHSRYSHSLGVMQTARRMLECLGRSCRIDPDLELICLVGSLLHDLGHGPFSHLFERVAGVSHEASTSQLIADPCSEVHRLLAEHDSALPERVAAFLATPEPRSFVHDILASQLDADRLDYLLRDSLMTGSGYGDYDLTWLVHALTIDPGSNRLAVTCKGVSAVEAYLQARYHMYRNVYFHKVVRSAEGMVKLVLQRAKRLAVQDRLAWPPREHVVSKSLLGQRLTSEEFTDLDDVSLLHCFKLWAAGDDAPLARLCHGLLYRRLFKTIDLSHLEAAEATEAVDRARRAVESAGGDGRYDLLYDEPADTPYETPGDRPLASGEILVHDASRGLIPFTALSPLPAALNRQLMFRRLHVAAEWKQVATEALGGRN